ncbi:hypothetical protein SERLA73DRAFT_138467 [Serpula lacrymans var. lacrymans S7.3]|uniref:Uncharacterized protein n=1 Tax=Serpula lacrymans var. lacrymans (strain S7.3) TaxID=936435 RepID=F8Q1I4_SERL3|nr:hypothetical protein SERLA73DRAFT_138467 [Serpula lacrymans var. lacrymans S7.3]
MVADGMQYNQAHDRSTQQWGVFDHGSLDFDVVSRHRRTGITGWLQMSMSRRCTERMRGPLPIGSS